MSKIFGVLNSAPSPRSSVDARGTRGLQAVPGESINQYDNLIKRLFEMRSVVAILGAGPAGEVTHVCEGIATELSAAGKRAVVVSVHSLLYPEPTVTADETSLVAEPVETGGSCKYWLWPARTGRRAESFDSRRAGSADKWLDSLRRNFDAVLLDCQTLESMPGATAVGAMADAAVLVVDARRTSRDQIIRDQRSLQLTGVKLAGCILTQEK